MTIAVLSLVLALALGTLWLWAALRLQMARWLPLLMGLSGMAVATALVALVEGGLAERILAALALPLPLVLAGLQVIAEQPDNPVAVRVGEPIKPFEALDGAGEVFSLRSLHGTKFLLKFYRGHW